MKSEFFSHKLYKVIGNRENGRVYLFYGFGGTTPFYLPAITKLRKNGFSIVAFRFKTKAALGFTIENLPKAIDEVCLAVAEAEQQKTSKSQSIALGNSMGSVFAWHVAGKVRSIDKVVANTAYALISKHIFEDKIGTHWRKQLEAEGINQSEFHQLILNSEPISVFDKLINKKVLLFMNKDDTVIGFSNAALFKQALESNKIDYKYVENHKMRHGTAIFRNLMSKTLLEFLKTK